MKKAIEYLKLVSILLGIVFVFYPGVYWFLNPELTEMQLFFKTWYYNIIGVVFFIIGTSK